MYSIPIVIDKVYLKIKLNEKKINVEKARKHIIWNKIWFGLNYQKILSLYLSKVNNGSTKSQNKKVFITSKQVCN